MKRNENNRRLGFVEINETVTKSGISIKNDGVGVVKRCSDSDLNNKSVLFDWSNKYKEYDGLLIMKKENIIAVIK